MSNPIQYRGYTIKIDVDDDPISPREDDNFGTMICFHRRYTLGDKHTYGSPQDVVLALTGMHEDELGVNPNDDLGDGSKYNIVWEPIYMYDHSGITIRTTPFDCRWDSGQLGIIYATYDQVRKHLGLAEGAALSKEDIEKAEAMLKAEVKAYDTYLRGCVYVMTITKDGEEVDCCGNLHGFDYAVQYAKEEIDALIPQDSTVEG